MGSGYLKKKKEMKKLQEQFEKMQKDVKELEETGEAGHGLVTVKLTGEYRIADIKIKPDCVDPEDVEGLQDLIRVAFNDAVNKIDAKTKNIEGLPNAGGFPF
ncbi:MAG: YbaB/EbfC family nucleoid-associated protein [Chlamydiia bacterium]|nr:YbaB/EbfC family nucleoid-associated protein [Chlamydiia bacterium]